ncbi:MAG: hypothetical protein EA350_05890 [Gemmatimonadales bacterium]|nr:MAG: hypothetical protein EA350_05890 [Gemmatimonadales bacterium]
MFDRRPDPILLRATLRAVVHPGSVVHASVHRPWTGWPGHTPPTRTRLARRRGGIRHDLAAEVSRQALDAARGARNLRQRLRSWLPRFRGIATRHLPAYLLWFSAWSHAFPNEGRVGTHPPEESPGHGGGMHGGGLRLLAVLLTPAEADP